MKSGAIFDMDGLMFDTEAIWQEGWRLFAQKYGYEPSQEFGKNISGTSGEVMENVVRTYYPTVDPPTFIAEERAYVEKRLESGIPVKDGLYEILDFFKECGVKMAVASSSGIEMIESNLKKTKTDGYFDAVVSSRQVEHAKPKPDVFLLAAEKIGIDPTDCYVFEDSFGGVQAGHAAGAVMVMIPDQLQPTAEIRALTDGVFTTLAEAAGAIRRGEL